MTKTQTDWLGQEYTVGDRILYAATSGRSINMVLAEVVSFNDSGTITVQPVKASRWSQHSPRSYFVDTRTGKHIDPYAPSGKHIAVHGHYIDKRSGEAVDDRLGYTGGISYEYRQYVSTQFQPWVEARKEEGPRPVTLTITQNICRVGNDVGAVRQ